MSTEEIHGIEQKKINSLFGLKYIIQENKHVLESINLKTGADNINIIQKHIKTI